MFCLEASHGWREFVAPDTAEVLAIVESLRQRGAENLTFMGGESFFRKDLPRIIGHARGLGMGRIAVATNGTALAHPGLVADMVAAGLDCVELSIHGHTAALANRISGKGFTFERQARAMAEIAATGSLTTVVNLVVCRDNRDHVVDVVDYATEALRGRGPGDRPNRGALGAKGRVPLYVKLKFVSRQGRAATAPSALRYDEIDLVRIGDQLAARGIDFWFDNVPLCRLGDHAGRAHELATLAVDEQYFDLDHHGPDGYYDSGHQLAGRVWPDPPCPTCALRPICAGIEETYRRDHGAAELTPRTDDPLPLIAAARAQRGMDREGAADRLATLAQAARPDRWTPQGQLCFAHPDESSPIELMVEAAGEDAPAYARVGTFALSYRLRSDADRVPSARVRDLLTAAVAALQEAAADGVDLAEARRRVAATRADDWLPAD